MRNSFSWLGIHTYIQTDRQTDKKERKDPKIGNMKCSRKH